MNLKIVFITMALALVGCLGIGDDDNDSPENTKDTDEQVEQEETSNTDDDDNGIVADLKFVHDQNFSSEYFSSTYDSDDSTWLNGQNASATVNGFLPCGTSESLVASTLKKLLPGLNNMIVAFGGIMVNVGESCEKCAVVFECTPGETVTFVSKIATSDVSDIVDFDFSSGLPFGDVSDFPTAYDEIVASNEYYYDQGPDYELYYTLERTIRTIEVTCGENGLVNPDDLRVLLSSENWDSENALNTTSHMMITATNEAGDSDTEYISCKALPTP